MSSFFNYYLLRVFYNGATIIPVSIMDNTITVSTGVGGNNAYGIYLNAYDEIFANITGNDMTGGNGIRGGSYAWGIWLSTSAGNIGYDGTTIDKVLIDLNPMTVTASVNSATGIYINANEIFADITGNSFSINGNSSSSYGIVLSSSWGNFGGSGAGEALDISGNTLSVVSDTGLANGIYLSTNGDIFADVVGNEIVGVISNSGDAYGIYLGTWEWEAIYCPISPETPAW